MSKQKPRPTVATPHLRVMMDTGAVVAVFDSTDDHHTEAVKFRDSVLKPYRVKVLTTSFIFQESLTRLKKRICEGRVPANVLVEARDYMRERELSVDQRAIDEAFDILTRYADQPFSMVDCTTFVLMTREQITAAFTFDDHFKIYRYHVGHESRGFLKLPEHTSLLQFV